MRKRAVAKRVAELMERRRMLRKVMPSHMEADAGLDSPDYWMKVGEYRQMARELDWLRSVVEGKAKGERSIMGGKPKDVEGFEDLLGIEGSVKGEGGGVKGEGGGVKGEGGEEEDGYKRFMTEVCDDVD